jgi:16S rRNA (adenine(1408)-N(1))-methyltransferase
MRILSGKKLIDISQNDFHERYARFDAVHIDIGTGSGRFVLKNALRNPECLFIGVDPVAAQITENAVKVQKQRLRNALFAVASVEELPPELTGIADAVTVCLPWGSLRDGVVKADPVVLNGLSGMGKPGAAVTIWVGYDERREAAEMEERGLPGLTAEYFKGLKEGYQAAWIELLRVSVLGNTELREMESDWAKRLSYGQPRKIYRLDCRKPLNPVPMQGII